MGGAARKAENTTRSKGKPHNFGVGAIASPGWTNAVRERVRCKAVEKAESRDMILSVRLSTSLRQGRPLLPSVVAAREIPGLFCQLCFEMADRTLSTMSVVRGATFGSNRVLLGVPKDRALHLLELSPVTGVVHPFRQRNPLYPPSPSFGGSPQPGANVLLDKQPRWRPPVWPESVFGLSGFLTAVCAGSAIWIWPEHPFTTPSGWLNFGLLPSTSTQPADVDSLVFLTDGGPKLAALRSRQLYVRDFPGGADWTPAATTKGATVVALSSVVAVRALTADGFGRFTETGTAGMVGIDVSGAVFQVAAGGTCAALLAGDQFNPDVLPAALAGGWQTHGRWRPADPNGTQYRRQPLDDGPRSDRSRQPVERPRGSRPCDRPWRRVPRPADLIVRIDSGGDPVARKINRPDS